MFDETSMDTTSFDITSILFDAVDVAVGLIRYPWAFLTRRRHR